MNKQWIRIRVVVDGKVVWGHAGRFGFILPNIKGVAGYRGMTYDGNFHDSADTVRDLKKILDAADPDVEIVL